MPRSPYTRISYQFGPGPLTPAVKALLIANGVLFLAQIALPALTTYGGLTPAAVLESFWFWQPVTYMFLHAGLTHLVFNMLALWMFGVELERMWGTQAFARFYMFCGLGAAATTIGASLLPVRLRGLPVRDADGRRLGRHLRAARGIRRAVREPADLHVLPLPGAGTDLRAHHRGHHVVVVGHVVGRPDGPPGSPRRTRDGLDAL